MPPLFEELLEVELGCEDTEGDDNSDFLVMDKMEYEEDDLLISCSMFQTPQRMQHHSPSGQQLRKGL